MNNIKNFFTDLFSIINYLYQFITSEKISRLRVLLVWFLIALIPSIVIAFTVNTWQVHIPGIETNQAAGGLVSYIGSTSILPLLFFITNGLRGYHELFNNILDAFFSNFEKKHTAELIEKYGEDEALRKLRKVDLGRYISAFLVLEFIIIAWAFTNYFLYGGSFTGLGLAGYVLDDLLLAALVLILEGVYSIIDGLIEAPAVYKLRLPNFIATTNQEAIEEISNEDPWDD